MRAIASRVCQLKPKAREAVAAIRRFRLGREPKGGALELADALNGCIDQFLKLHPSMTWDTVQDAPATARGAVETSKRKKGE